MENQYKTLQNNLSIWALRWTWYEGKCCRVPLDIELEIVHLVTRINSVAIFTSRPTYSRGNSPRYPWIGGSLGPKVGPRVDPRIGPKVGPKIGTRASLAHVEKRTFPYTCRKLQHDSSPNLIWLRWMEYCHKALGSCNICGSVWITEWCNYEKHYWVMSVNKAVRSVWNKNKMGIVKFGQLKKKPFLVVLQRLLLHCHIWGL